MNKIYKNLGKEPPNCTLSKLINETLKLTTIHNFTGENQIQQIDLSKTKMKDLWLKVIKAIAKINGILLRIIAHIFNIYGYICLKLKLLFIDKVTNYCALDDLFKGLEFKFNIKRV